MLSAKSLNLEYRAIVSGANPISKVNFTLSGPRNQKYTDSDGSDGWSWILDFENYPSGTYSLSAKAIDTQGLVSAEKSYEIVALNFPKWIVDIGASVGPFEITFSNGVLCYKISSEGWDFFDKSDKGAGSTNDPLTNDETSTTTTAEISVALYSNGIGEIQGKIGGEAKMIGKAPVFVKKISGGIEAGGQVNIYTFEVITGYIEGYLSVDLEQLYGIVIPIINWEAGIKIKGIPTLEVTYSFQTSNGEFTNQSLAVTVGAYIQGGIVVGVVDGDYAQFGCGAEGFGYAEPSLTGQYPTEPPFKIKIAVGAGGTINFFGAKYGGTWEAFKWGWPSYRNVTKYNLTRTQMPMYGSNVTAGDSPLLASDIFYDDDPYVTFDNAGQVYAVWVTNKTMPNQMRVVYSVFDGYSWSPPQTISDSPYAKLHPVIAFDAINNRGVVVWVQINTNLTRDSTLDEIFNSYSSMELYYSVYSDGIWSSPAHLTNDTSADALPAIAADNQGNIMVVWEHDYDGNFSTRTDRDIFFSIWNTYSQAWSQPQPIAVLSERDTQPVIAFNSTGGAVVVWIHDENSSRSSFENKPPRIVESFTHPSSPALNSPIKIFAKVIDESISTDVSANITFPDSTVQQVTMTFNATSGYYEGTITASQEGTYIVNIAAKDPEEKKSQIYLVLSTSQLGNNPPIVNNATCSRNFVHINRKVNITAKVKDDAGISNVWAQITIGQTSLNISLTRTSDNLTYIGEYTPTIAGFHHVKIFANDTNGAVSYVYIPNAFEAVLGVDTEIYYAKWDPITGWKQPQCITDRFDYQASQSPTVIYDSNDTGVIVWEEHFEDGNSLLYNAFLLSENSPGFTDAIKPEKSVNLKYGNREPKLARTNNGWILLTWRADSPNPEEAGTVWPEIYYAVLNSTKAAILRLGEFIAPVWSYPERLTYNCIPDWKPTVTIDPVTNKVTIVWLGHTTTLEGDITTGNFTLAQDDDDLYFEHFEFPIKMSGLNEVTRMADGSPENLLVFNRKVKDKIIYVNIPAFAYPCWNASMLLTGIANSIGQYPTNVSIDLGNDGDYELIIPLLNNTVTYYLNVPDNFEELDTYLQNRWLIEDLDGEPDGKVKVPIRIHSDTPGRIKIWGIKIGFSFDCRQRTEVPGNLPPTLGVPSQIVASENEEIVIRPIASDPNRDSLSFSINDTRFDQKREIFRWIPGEGDKGNFTVKITVSDRFLTDEKTIKIVVLDDNKPPAVSLPSEITVQEGETVRIIAFATDPNDDMLGYLINDTRFQQKMNVFTWQTQAGDAGTYTVLITVTDGVYQISQKVIITVNRPAVRDVAVTRITFAKTIIFQGYTIPINVTAENQGDTFIETFDITLYAGTSVIGQELVSNLLPLTNTSLTFTWNTTGFAKGNYTISAYATWVPNETDIMDNNLTGGWIIITMIGDITGSNGWPDGKVDIRDVARVAILFGVNYPDPRYDPNCDITGPTPGVPDGKIDIRDISLVAKHFGKTDP